MKKIVTISFFLLSIALFAQLQQGLAGNLTVFSDDGTKFKLYLNGELQNETSKANVRVENLTQKVYSAKIQFEDPSLPTISAQSVEIGNYNAFGDIDFYDVTYKIKIDKKNKTKLVYFARVPIIQTPIIIDHPPVTPVVIVDNGGGRDPYYNGGGRPPYGGGRPPVPQPRGCAGKREMRPADFQNAKIAINKETFSSDKVKLINRIITDNCMSTNQISELMKTYFTFDNERLEIAILAYEYCVDPRNYYQLNSLLNFSSSKDKLNQYVQSKG